MATRELTRTFLQLRSDAKAKSLRRRNIVGPSEEAKNALMKNGDHLTRVDVAPVWVDVVGETNQHVARIKEMMDRLNKLHTKRLMVRFDGSESKHEQEIEEVTQQITSEFRNAERGLQKMASRDDQSAADAKTRQNVQRALATQLQSLSGEFRRTQKEYLGRVKNQKSGPAEFGFLDNPKPDRRSLDMGFNQAQITEVEIAEDLINERDQEIQRIAESITELATIFKELAVLVIDQGTILDRIDYNMEQVVEQTEKGIVELEQAEKIQKNNRPAKCIGLLLVLIFIMTLLLILKHS
uniref:t-SNARE coiled-coil homology domain-containing protein n=1 Tax=Globisporangium ultimum (strain ATCC 200006 / CBS 805.95 / DAOM BR144) TaxID=431595 RepID=K3X8E8_GLOUD